MKHKNLILIVCATLACCIGMVQWSEAAEVKPETPIVVTTCGKSPGALMIKLVCKRVKIECTQKDDLTADDIKGGNYKTVIITMGTSGKGMGAAGTDIDAEVARIEAIIAEARNQGMTVIGAHIEGMSRRVDESDQRSIDAVAPVSDILIVKEESNSDGLFTKIAEKENIPLYSAKETLDLTETFKELFGTN